MPILPSPLTFLRFELVPHCAQIVYSNYLATAARKQPSEMTGPLIIHSLTHSLTHCLIDADRLHDWALG